MSAETKVYEVPRELIEIARARAHGVDPAGKTTPLAPRPDAEQQATLRAYTARLSIKPPRVPSVLLDDAIAVDIEVEPSSALELEPDARAMPGADRSLALPSAAERSASKPAAAPEPSRLERRPSSRRSALRESAPRVREAHPASESRAWMVYAALSLLGLASCVHLLLAP
jgi:hypothetical protein